MKPIKFALAVVIKNPKNPDEVLAVLRPPDAKSLPNIWGLPAVSLKENETPEVAIVRLGKEKLATTIVPKEFIGVDTDERDSHQLVLMDIEVEVTGPEPEVQKGTTNDTKYTGQKWTSDYSVFIPGAQKGSVCDRVFLKSRGISWQ